MATGGINLATSFSPKVDERFTRQSQAMMALNNDYSFTGVETVKVYSIPVVPMNDYTRSGENRYGASRDLTRNVQTLTVKKDRSYSFVIDRGDRIQSQMVMDAGKALRRQTDEVFIPEFDTYVFNTLAAAATDRGNFSDTAITAKNAYSAFLEARESLGNHNVPDAGQVCFCTYRYASLIRQDPAFMKNGDMSQEMVEKGVFGMVDGCKMVRVPSSRLPAGAAFLLVHPSAATAPKQLQDYRIHEDPVGISGWKVEGRFIYDCFVLNEKANGIFYHGSQPVLKNLNVTTAATDSGKSTILVEPSTPEAGNVWFYKTAATFAELPVVAASEAITTSAWTALSGTGKEITPSGSDTVIAVVEATSEGDFPKAHGVGVLNIG